MSALISKLGNTPQSTGSIPKLSRRASEEFQVYSDWKIYTSGPEVQTAT